MHSDSQDSDDDVPLKYLLHASGVEAARNDKVRKEHYDRLTEVLHVNGHKLVKVPEDGDCIFTALHMQLQDNKNISVQDVRELVCDYMITHETTYKPLTSLENFHVECLGMKQKGTWKSEVFDIVFAALANITQRQVLIYTSHPGQPFIEYSPTVKQDPVLKVQHQVVCLARISIQGHEHYDIFEPAKPTDKISGEPANHQVNQATYKTGNEELIFHDQQISDNPCTSVVIVPCPSPTFSDIDDDLLIASEKQILEQGEVESWFIREMETAAEQKYENSNTTNTNKHDDSGSSGSAKLDSGLNEPGEINCSHESAEAHTELMEFDVPVPLVETDVDSTLLVNNVDQSQSDGDDIQYRKRRKRKKADRDSWRSNTRKRLRNCGQAYVGVTGKLVPERKVGQHCSNCKFKCTENFDGNDRQATFSSFWQTGNKSSQSAFIISMVEEGEPISQRRKSTNIHNVVRRYHLKKNGIRYRVCKTFFLSTLDISATTVTTAMRNSKSGFPEVERRGRHTPATKISEPDIDFVCQHISTFPVMKPHYNRHDSTRDYLDPSLNIRVMYALYKEFCSKHDRCPVKEPIYRRTFHENFNLSFHKPKKDTCLLCDKHENGLTTDTDHQIHIERKTEAQHEKESDKMRAKIDPMFHVCAFDLEQVLSTPNTSTGTIFYKRKLSVYNLSVYSLGTGSGTCFLWDETEGKRGANEIGTAMNLYIKSIPSMINHLVLYSDNCGGQNKNKHFAASVLNAMRENENIMTVDHKFLERGHTHSEVDSLHAAVENAKRRVPVYVPRDWETVCRMARKRKRPYNVITITHNMFLNFKDFTSEIPVVNKITWKGTCMIRYQKVQLEDGSHDVEVLMKDSFSNEFTRIRAKKTRTSAVIKDTSKPAQLYEDQLTISEKKKSDLLALCRDGTIPALYHNFYQQLPCSKDVDDRLPATDDEESSTSDNEP